MSSSNKTRGFVVTQWNLECKYQEVMDKRGIAYLAYGLETCPTTKRPHHQLFLYFDSPRSTAKSNLKRIGEWWGPTHCHVEAMAGTFAENEDYSSKQGDLVEFGERPQQGARHDLTLLRNELREGKRRADDIAEEQPHLFHQYGRTLERLETIYLRRRFRTEMTEGIWYTGPSGAGKSHMAFAGFDPATHYVKNVNENWWDGYKGQETVIINEFRGQIPFSELLDLADKWPKNVQWRGKESVPFLAKRVIIASVKTPEEVYRNQTEDEPWEQFYRRFRVVKIAPRQRAAK